MRRLGTLLMLAALVSCASQPESADVPEIAASAPISTAAAVIDERDWLREFRVRYAAVKTASRGDDVKALLRDAEAAYAWSPDVPTVQYLLALAYAADGQNDRALTTLATMADGGLGANISASPAFAPLQGDPRFAALVQRFEANAAPRGVIDLAFTAHGLPTDFIPESIVRDVVHDRWLMGSVRQRRIDAVDDQGAAYDFVSADAGGLLSALGMRLIGDTLWVASSGFNESGAIAKTQIGRAALFEIDATRGTVRKTWWLPDDGQMHALGDVLIVGSDIYCSDSLAGGVYRLSAQRERLEPIVPGGLLLSPQGMVALDEQRLVIADYPTGLWLLDPASGALQRLRTSQPAALTGLDGIYEHEGTLIAIQNGTTPKRVLRIRLNPAKNAIEHVDVLAQNLFGWGEPGLATIHDGALYYIANSQWDQFDENGGLPPADQLEAPRIMRLQLW